MKLKLFASCLGLFALLAAAHGEGLDATYGKALPDFNLKGKTFKVLDKGNLAGGASKEFKNIIFEKNEKAILIGLGEGAGSDLDMYVIDNKTGKAIGQDILLDNVPVVEWKTGDSDRYVVNIRLSNAGKAPCNYILIANW